MISGLSQDSIDLINTYNNVLDVVLSNLDLCVPRELLSYSRNVDNKLIQWNIKQYAKKFKWIKTKLPEVFFYRHWIKSIPNIVEYTNWKDLIDCWSFIWDSALMLNDALKLDKIYCCEPDSQNYKTLCSVIQINKKSNVIPLKIWVWINDEILRFNSWNFWASEVDANWESEIIVKKIDTLVEQEKIKPWLIKRDIEWLEYDSIIWAEKTIKKFRPDLLISIYHTPKDFFEIKPLLESWNLWYKFKIVHCTEWLRNTEIMLLAYID